MNNSTRLSKKREDAKRQLTKDQVAQQQQELIANVLDLSNSMMRSTTSLHMAIFDCRSGSRCSVVLIILLVCSGAVTLLLEVCKGC